MDKRILQLFSKRIGPRLPTKLSPFVGSLIGLYRRHITETLDGLRPKFAVFVDGIHVDLVDKVHLNAAAFSDGSNEMVGLNAGVAAIIPCIANWLLSHPGVFPDVGSPSSETVPGSIDLSMLTARGRMSAVTKRTFTLPLTIPKDPTRQFYAHYISTSAWNFLLTHEFGHINRCHQQFFATRVGNAQPLALREIHKEVLERDARLHRMLEIDADLFAARALAGAPLQDGLEATRFQAFGPVDTSEVAWDWPRAFETWMRAVGLLFNLMSIVDSRRNFREELRTHPHPDIRIQLMVRRSKPARRRW
jgi:hypothetical protein